MATPVDRLRVLPLGADPSLRRRYMVLDEEVPSFHAGREALGLDGRGRGEAALLQGGEKGFGAAEGCEGQFTHWYLPGLSLRECQMAVF